MPYSDGEIERALYPDFVFIHKTEQGLLPSIVDPHNHSFADTVPKWRALAEYAQRHGELFGRIDAVIRDENGVLLRLDLKDPTIQSALGDGLAGKEQVSQLFRDHGGVYV